MLNHYKNDEIMNKIIQKIMKRQKASHPIMKATNNLNYNLPQIDPNTFNQTIIINNPNFNINYIESSAQPNNVQLNALKQQSARKTQNDNWNLNYNLKQFSETRQVGGFFNNKQKRTVSNSPYLIPKNKTQDIKPVSKMRPSQTIAYGAPYKSNLNPPKSNKSIPVINRQHSPKNSNTGTLPPQLTLNRQPLQGTLTNFRSKKYHYTQKTPRQILTHRTIGQPSNLQQTKIQQGKDSRSELTDKLKNGIIHSAINANYNKIKPNIRRNRFSSVQEEDRSRQNTNKTVLQQQKQDNKSQQEQVESPTHQLKDYKKQQNKANRPKFYNKYHSQSYSQYSKSIQMIHQSLLSNINDYMEGENDTKQDIPASKIQLYMSTMREPQPIYNSHNHNNPQYRSTPLDLWQQYDFKFDQEKVKKRPKTPKRKKLYQ